MVIVSDPQILNKKCSRHDIFVLCWFVCVWVSSFLEVVGKFSLVTNFLSKGWSTANAAVCSLPLMCVVGFRVFWNFQLIPNGIVIPWWSQTQLPNVWSCPSLVLSTQVWIPIPIFFIQLYVHVNVFPICISRVNFFLFLIKSNFNDLLDVTQTTLLTFN